MLTVHCEIGGQQTSSPRMSGAPTPALIAVRLSKIRGKCLHMERVPFRHRIW